MHRRSCAPSINDDHQSDLRTILFIGKFLQTSRTLGDHSAADEAFLLTTSSSIPLDLTAATDLPPSGANVLIDLCDYPSSDASKLLKVISIRRDDDDGDVFWRDQSTARHSTIERRRATAASQMSTVFMILDWSSCFPGAGPASTVQVRHTAQRDRVAAEVPVSGSAE